jgi:hypothetical protein
MKIQVLLAFLFLIIATSQAQINTQTVKGTITDKISDKPIAGATITIGTATTASNINGVFVLKNVALGRVEVAIVALGYKNITIPEVLVTNGKEVIVEIALEQDFKTLGAVTIKAAKAKKGNASNKFVGTSSRSFSMEEVTRFAGGRNDPSKLVSSFSGVVKPMLNRLTHSIFRC